MIESDRLVRFLSREDFRIACMSMDVADGDISNLIAAYKQTQQKLEDKGISLDRLWVKAVSVKFNTPNALFEFMEKYDTYLLNEGIVVNGYKPWIQSSTSIPPLAGGVGRQRALSKAVYSLNYYHYTELNSVLSVFKDRVLTSKYQPVVFVVFGLGGGTGSGMLFDFCRHLRAKLGTAIPIVGLAILPSSADDMKARGPAPYSALLEGDLLFNKELNDKVAKRFGEQYRNPFNALFFLALDPVSNNKNSLLSAKKELDEAVIDILNVFMNFDLADLLSGIGTNNDFGASWVHSIAYLKIRYPVGDYLKYLHEVLKLSESAGSFMVMKRQLLQGINEVMARRLAESTRLFQDHLASIDSYRPETFDSEVNELVHRAGKYDVEFRRQIKGVEDFIAYYNDRWSKSLDAMAFKADTAEYAIVEKLRQWKQEIAQISRTYEDFSKNLPSYEDEFESSVTATKSLTSSHLRQMRSFMELLGLVGTAIETTDLYLRAKALTDELAVRYAKDKTDDGKRIVAMGETELSPLYKAASTILTRPETEQKMMEQFLPGIRLVRKNVETRFRNERREIESIQRQLAQKEAEQRRLTTEISKIKLDLSGKKKNLSRSLDNVKSDSASLQASMEEIIKGSNDLSSELEQIAEIDKNLESTSQYRKSLTAMVNKATELNSMISSITNTSSYYERVVELSETEQLKIVERILREEEDSLKAEGVLKDIVDKERFRDLVKSYIRIFSVPTYAGLSDSYRTDMIWATVGMPPGLWDQELQTMLSSTLNAFSSVEASKSISIRQIHQVDTWTITFLLILAKARIDQLEQFSSMKNNAAAVRKSERLMFRSFLLEHGVEDPGELANMLESSDAPRAASKEGK